MLGRLNKTKTLMIAISLIAMTVLSACETTVSSPVIPELSFKHLPALKFAVGRIETVENYRSALRPPNVEHLFPSPISAALLPPGDAAPARRDHSALRFRRACW